MKQFISFLVACLIIVNMQAQNDTVGIVFAHGSWEQIKALAKAEDKSIFIDCYTEWCGPCKMLSKKVFPQKEVGDLFNAHFINYKVDMEKGEGIMLKEKFNVRAFPTLVWVDADGNELHKSVGAPKAQALIDIAQLVVDGKGLADLERKYLLNKEDTTTMNTYLKALANAYEKDKIQGVLAEYFKKVKGTELLDEYNYNLIHNYLSDVALPAFLWFDEHKEEFANRYGKEKVERKLYQSYLGYGHSFVSKKDGQTMVDSAGFRKYKLLLNERRVEGREKIVAFVEESICRANNNWDAYIAKVKSNIEAGYHGQPNAFLYYNWAKAIEKGTDAKIRHYQQAVQWMEDAFTASQWPLKNNIVYLNEKVKLLELAKADQSILDSEKERIETLKQKVADENAKKN
ncbi:Thioredoxin [Saccharicrinis carchari]|uniref:Thioredoxin n=1 Tax=Saccharicrinis carchari TaxID=1168039 RepID=A0A521EHU2_SACCC|nr:thioredoxin domain-containing protein [Saccharicrinis carchari]SMO83465.1 Thioredoxin [Saccharicrinis carchari]